MDISTSELPKNGKSRSAQLSSNATLFWRVFVPVFGTVFLSGLALALWLTDENDLYLTLMPVLAARIFFTLLLIGWLLLLRRTIWRLVRVDADDTHVFITNYWTTVRYPWDDVAALDETLHVFKRRPVMHLHLKAPGRFGAKVSFLPGSSLREWLAAHDKEELLLAN